MLSMQTVSLILPVYKSRADWLEQAFASIKSQTYKAIELIRVDNVQGAWKARNIGLKRSTGDLIAFCDADDYLEPDAIEKMVKAIDGVEMVCGSFRKFGEFEMIISDSGKLPLEDIASYAMGNLKNPRTRQMLSGCWAKLYRRSIVGEFPPLATAEDMAFNFDCLQRCDSVRFISDIVYHNRKHSDSLTTTFDGSLGMFGFLVGLKRVKRFLDGFYPEDEIDDAIDISKLYHSLLYAQRIGPDALKKVFPL